MIGIALGDFTGIGPEVSLRALARLQEADETRYLLIGDAALTRNLNVDLQTNLPLQPFEGLECRGRFLLLDPRTEPLAPNLHSGAPAAALAALDYLKEGARRCLANELNALITAPVSKESILRAGHAFVGQTELLSEIAGTNRTAMMLLGDDDRGRWLRVVLATTHLPLRHVADQLTSAKVELAVELAAQACRDLGVARARVGVCGLNPHAGEGGRLGTEELTVIAPAVRSMQQRGIDARGPLSADALFHQAYHGDYDAVVAMYHDQGLAPLKLIAFENGVNWTLGLPFIRTSPDHGTAFDIARQRKASPSSMIAAIKLAKRLNCDTSD